MHYSSIYIALKILRYRPEGLREQAVPLPNAKIQLIVHPGGGPLQSEVQVLGQEKGSSITEYECNAATV